MTLQTLFISTQHISYLMHILINNTYNQLMKQLAKLGWEEASHRDFKPLMICENFFNVIPAKSKSAVPHDPCEGKSQIGSNQSSQINTVNTIIFPCIIPRI